MKTRIIPARFAVRQCRRSVDDVDVQRLEALDAARLVLGIDAEVDPVPLDRPAGIRGDGVTVPFHVEPGTEWDEPRIDGDDTVACLQAGPRDPAPVATAVVWIVGRGDHGEHPPTGEVSA